MKLFFLLSVMLAGFTMADTDRGIKAAEYMKENAKKRGVIVLPSGLQYEVIESGSGLGHPLPSTSCKCHYKGWLYENSPDNTFDSSYQRGEPSEFAPNQVVPGWTEALQLMVEGDKWELTIPPNLGYGQNGAGGSIPGNSVLKFILEIISIKGPTVPATPKSSCLAGKVFGSSKSDDTCTEKEAKYIIKMKKKVADDEDVAASLSKEIDRIRSVFKTTAAKSDTATWAKTRIALLTKVVQHLSTDKDEL